MTKSVKTIFDAPIIIMGLFTCGSFHVKYQLVLSKNVDEFFKIVGPKFGQVRMLLDSNGKSTTMTH